jgi:inverted formin-2
LLKQINLLDSKRSLNINIYLKQFRCSPDEIVRLLSNNENHELGLENLEGMLKILPDANEVKKFLKIYFFLIFNFNS